MFKNLWFKIIAWVLTFASAIYIVFNYDLFYCNVFSGKKMIENPTYCVFTANGEKVMVNKSSSEILGITKDNKISFYKKSKVSPIEDFNYVSKICCDDDGNFYILDLKLNTDQIAEAYSIIKFNKKGKIIKTIVEKDTELSDTDGVSHIFMLKNKFYYIYNKSDKFFIKNEKRETVREYYCDTKMIFQYEVKDLDDVMVLTKRGEFKALNQGFEEIFFDGNQNKDSVPFSFSLLSDGSIIYSDIGTRQIFLVRDSFSPAEIVFDRQEEDFLENPLYNKITARGTADKFELVAPEEEMLMFFSKELQKPLYYESYEFSSDFKTEYIFFIGSCVIAGIALLFVLFFAIKKIIKSKSFVVKITSLVLLGTVTLTVLFSAISFKNFNSRIVGEIQKRSGVVGKLVSSQLPFDAFERLERNSQYMDDDYRAVKDTVDRVFSENPEMTKGFYCTLYTITNNGTVVSAVYDNSVAHPGMTPLFPYTEDSTEYKIMATQQGVVRSNMSTFEGSFIFILDPIINSEGVSIGCIEIGSNFDSLSNENNDLLFNLFLNIISMALFVVLFLVEILKFVNGCKKVKIGIHTLGTEIENNETPKKIKGFFGSKLNMNSDMSSMLTFLIYFITNITTGFYTIYVFSISPPMWGMPKEIIAGIPIAAETAGGIVSVMIANKVMELIKKRKTSLFFSIMFCAGMFIRSIFKDILMFTLGNFICGLGWGIVIMIVDMLLTKESNAEKFAANENSIMSARVCGMALGSFLTNWFSNQAIMLFSSSLGIFVLLFSMLYIKNDANIQRTQKSEGSGINVVQFVFSAKILSYMFLVFIPIMIVGLYSSYLFPVLADGMMVSETYIGYVFMINSVCAIVLSKSLTEYFSSKMSRSSGIFLSVLLYALAMVLYVRFPTISMLIFSIILFGVAGSFGGPFLSSYFSDLEIVKKYGEKSASVKSIFDNLAQIVGPFIFGSFLIFNVKEGIMYTSMILSALGFMFFIKNNFRIKRISENK
jgi:predicted MFS family arabinose efflux permease